MTARLLPSLAALVAMAPLLAACGSAGQASSYGPRTAQGAGPYATAGAAFDLDDGGRAPEASAPPHVPGALSFSDDALGGASERAPLSAAPPSGGAPSSPAPGRGAGATAPKPADPAAEAPRARELVIYTARFVMAVFQVEQGLAAVEKIATDFGGYMALRNDREIVVRVPRGRFDEAVAAMDGVGDILQRDIRAEDVTEAHVDLEIRIKNARAMQQRLTELLGRAPVKEALEIEKELRRVTEELELLEGRMKVLRDRIAFSTVTVSFQPRGERIPSARVHLPFRWLSSVSLGTLLSLTEDK